MNAALLPQPGGFEGLLPGLVTRGPVRSSRPGSCRERRKSDRSQFRSASPLILTNGDDGVFPCVEELDHLRPEVVEIVEPVCT
jgi:hypothetical protein